MFKGNSLAIEALKSKIILLFKQHSLPRWLVFIHDNFAVFVAFIIAYVLRFNFEFHSFQSFNYLEQAIAATLLYTVFSIVLRPYSGLIRHTTVIDIFNIFMATSLSFVSLLIVTLLQSQISLLMLFRIPLSVLIIHYFLVTVYLFAVRLLIKAVYHSLVSQPQNKRNVIIYGAGDMGVIVKRVLMSDLKGEYHITCFIDRNKNLHGKKLNGIPVFPPNHLTGNFIERYNIKTMVFAIKNIIPAEKSKIIKEALDLGLEVRDTPAVEEWLNGELQIRQIQKVKLEDLLGRDPIDLNIKKIGTGLKGKTILVTGAAGSIGSEIVRQIIRFDIGKLILADQAETPIFEMGNELKSIDNCCEFDIILADITHEERMERVFNDYKPDMVFHAAAYKHVPVMEENPHEAIRVNVGGTRLISELAVKHGVKKFVMVSTDKAVNPTNIMGASKRLCEMVVQVFSKMQGNQTQFIITRFGNVLGSNGSVIPIFEKQIREGGPLTVTHPEITRYFMTIPEACQLVLEAGFLGKGGEIYVFDMGKPVKIADLASQMIRLSGFVPDKDIKIEYTGLRPGEKLFEELLNNEEITGKTHHPKIKIARVKDFADENLLMLINHLVENIYAYSKQEVAEVLKYMVPEFNTNNEFYSGCNQPGPIEIVDRENVTRPPKAPMIKIKLKKRPEIISGAGAEQE